MSLSVDQSKHYPIILYTEEATHRSVANNLSSLGYSRKTIELSRDEGEKTYKPLEIIDQNQVKRQSELLGIPEIVLVAFNDVMKLEGKAPSTANFVTWIMKLCVDRGGWLSI